MFVAQIYRFLNMLCRYNDAMATIRRAPAVEHHFQLVITRVYEEGDQELLEDEDESMCHCPFIVLFAQ